MNPSIIFFFILILLAPSPLPSPAVSAADPTPTPWPHQFHSILFMNYSGILQMIDLWYDWPNGRNFNIIHHQLGDVLYDLEWNNGTSFFYTLDSSRECSSAQLEVGILRPNWLDGATYLGQRRVDGFLCNAWEKADFIVYYEDVDTKRPVHWVFYTGRVAHVMTFEVGAALEDEKWQAPVYCFDKEKKNKKKQRKKRDMDDWELLGGRGLHQPSMQQYICGLKCQNNVNMTFEVGAAVEDGKLQAHLMDMDGWEQRTSPTILACRRSP